MSAPDTSAAAVERVCRNQHMRPGYIGTVEEACAMLRALLAERDAAVERGTRWFAEATVAKAERDAAREALRGLYDYARCWPAEDGSRFHELLIKAHAALARGGESG